MVTKKKLLKIKTDHRKSRRR